MLIYTVAHEWEGDSSRRVMEGLKNFNVPFIGTDHPKQFAIIVRDEQERIVAGLLSQLWTFKRGGFTKNSGTKFLPLSKIIREGMRGS